MKSLILGVILAAARLAAADDTLAKAYDALKGKDYDRAIPAFLRAVKVSPARADIRKDLAYTYLKIGESESARDQFGEAMKLDPSDTHVAPSTPSFAMRAGWMDWCGKRPRGASSIA